MPILRSAFIAFSRNQNLRRFAERSNLVDLAVLAGAGGLSMLPEGSGRLSRDAFGSMARKYLPGMVAR